MKVRFYLRVMCECKPFFSFRQPHADEFSGELLDQSEWMEGKENPPRRSNEPSWPRQLVVHSIRKIAGSGCEEAREIWRETKA